KSPSKRAFEKWKWRFSFYGNQKGRRKRGSKKKGTEGERRGEERGRSWSELATKCLENSILVKGREVRTGDGESKTESKMGNVNEEIGPPSDNLSAVFFQALLVREGGEESGRRRNKTGSR